MIEGMSGPSSPRLTPKQRRFAHEFVTDHNATRAARAAGYRDGPGLRVSASNLLRKPLVAELVAQLEKELLAKVDSKADQVVRELHHLGLARITRLLNADGSVKPREEWPEAEAAAVSEFTVKEIVEPRLDPETGEIKPTVVGRVVTIEMDSKLSALKTLMEHHGLVEGGSGGTDLTLAAYILMARAQHELKERAGGRAGAGVFVEGSRPTDAPTGKEIR